MRLDARLGYGLIAPTWLSAPSGKQGLLTPYSEIALTGNRRNYRLGLQWQLDTGLAIDLIGNRQENMENAVEHNILLEGSLQF